MGLEKAVRRLEASTMLSSMGALWTAVCRLLTEFRFMSITTHHQGLPFLVRARKKSFSVFE